MKKVVLLILSAFLILTVSCSKETRKSESVLDNPQTHINMGIKLFDKGDYEKAKKEFDDAIFIKWEKESDKAGAYAGLGMYWAVKGDEDKAIDNAKEARSLNDDLPLVWTSYGRTIMYLNEKKDDKDWYDDAEDKFEEAIELADKLRSDDEKATAYYWQGIAAKKAYKFTESKNSFAEVVKLKTVYSTEANEEWEKVQMIERAKPGTKVGAKIALMDEVGKAEIAVLFIEELDIEQILDKREKKEYKTGFEAPEDPMKYEADKLVKAQKATDISGHWAESWISTVLKRGIMEAGPDHKFMPDEKITKAEYAQMLLRVLVIISNDESLYTKFFGADESIFPDVRTDQYFYNAIAVLATRGVMKAKLNGEFGPMDKVSGAQALLTIRDFQNALRLNL